MIELKTLLSFCGQRWIIDEKMIISCTLKLVTVCLHTVTATIRTVHTRSVWARPLKSREAIKLKYQTCMVKPHSWSMSSFTHRCTEEHIHKLINAPWSFHNTTRVAWLGELHQTQRKQLTLLALRNKLSLFPLQTRNRMEMLSEAWSGRKRRNRWHAERKEGQEWGQNAKDEERVGK